MYEMLKCLETHLIMTGVDPMGTANWPVDSGDFLIFYRVLKKCFNFNWFNAIHFYFVYIKNVWFNNVIEEVNRISLHVVMCTK